jgi:plasmid stabilization system protein ParE
MRLRWTPAAPDDLEAIASYLAKHFPSFMEGTIRKIYGTIVTLRSTPNRGRVGREEGTHELVIVGLPNIFVYRIRNDALEVLHIYHGAQNRP